MRNQILRMVNKCLPKNCEVIKMTNRCTVTRYKQDNKIIDEVCIIISGGPFNNDCKLNVTYHCYAYKKSIVCNNYLNINHLLYMLKLNDFYDKHITQVIDKPEFK